jgi:hypothetical protein
VLTQAVFAPLTVLGKAWTVVERTRAQPKTLTGVISGIGLAAASVLAAKLLNICD